ncbi:polysaccharide deacetylase [Streptomyces sp. NPDC051561]|uniref:polysaccharide deacetylase n=1 Tax=Streptomyces sp. NPDC051561 TaxID=3365658 RepID=UPI003799E16C
MNRSIRSFLVLCAVSAFGVAGAGVGVAQAQVPEPTSTTYARGVTPAEALKVERTKRGQSAAAARVVCYRAHVADHGWLGTTCDGNWAGSFGLNKAMESLEVAVGGVGRVCVRAHLRNYGWENFSCANDYVNVRVGTVGQARPMEAVEIAVSSGRVTAQAHVQNVGTMAARNDGVVTVGTEGRALNLEAIALWV